jgi:RHS repeat-associated protein
MAMSVTYTNFCGQIVHENRNGTESFYAPDTLGSTAMLLSPAGVVTDTYTYWSYGEIADHNGSSTTPLTFVGTLGYYLDLLGSLVYVRARHLRQALARWQTVDLIWPHAQAYEYCMNSPVLSVEPNGLWPWDTCGFIIWAGDLCNIIMKSTCAATCGFKGQLGLCLKLGLTCNSTCSCIGFPGPPDIRQICSAECNRKCINYSDPYCYPKCMGACLGMKLPVEDPWPIRAACAGPTSVV